MPTLFGGAAKIAEIKFNNSGLFSLHALDMESETLCFDVINTDYQSYIIPFTHDDNLAGYEDLLDLLPCHADECLIKKITTFAVTGKNYARYVVIAKDKLSTFTSMATKLGLGIHSNYDIWSYFLKTIPTKVDRASYFIEINNIIYQFEISLGNIIEHKILSNNTKKFHSEAPVWFCAVRDEALKALEYKADIKIIDELLVPRANYMQCRNCAFITIFSTLVAILMSSYMFYLLINTGIGQKNYSFDRTIETLLNANLALPENSYISRIEASNNNILLRGYYSDANTYSKVGNIFSQSWHLRDLGDHIFEADYV